MWMCTISYVKSKRWHVFPVEHAERLPTGPRLCLIAVKNCVMMIGIFFLALWDNWRVFLALQLVRQEEELRAEEEAFYEAKREAARTAKKQQLSKAIAAAKSAMANSCALDDDSDWELWVPPYKYASIDIVSVRRSVVAHYVN